ncbi:alpha/beta hydrolase [Massilia sp. Leaf139]|uniref:PHA/PHB synthase family protein n=1 Tax=Massilia sp. Leaf139 TaxID=1736272 RepID=UPI0006F547E9|nr:alpha/beta fold hydrolase [Massilia sp. Leaf139]KQQ97137.1 poly-beta-hydroxybutyrate polymerase [Massilia sp. Leaf139]
MNQPGFPTAAQRERDASAWQGTHHHYPEAAVEHAAADLALNAWIGRFTGHVSPAALALAWLDWSSHLLLSPDKQAELATHAVSAAWRWLEYCGGALAASPTNLAGPVAPLAQDKRFVDPAWEHWPWNALSQAFLLQQQWWHRATNSVRGVSQHHADVVTFVTRQLLDGVAPSNFVATNPVIQQATLERHGMNLVAGVAHAAQDAWRAASGQASLPGLLPGREVATTPGKIVLRNRLAELLRYDPVTPQVHTTPLLIVPAWIMKYYILDLSPHNSLVRYLVGQGHTVYVISWKNPGSAERDLGLDDYRRLGIMAALDAIVRETGAPRVNACGYCLGGTLLAIAAAAMARDHDRRLASLTLLAAQVDFTEPGELSLFIDESEVSFLEATMWSQGYLDTRQMAGAFQLLRSNDLIWSRQVRHYLLDVPERQTDLMSWNADATRMPYRMHSEYLRRLFLDNDLASARLMVDGRPVALPDIAAPIFAVGTRTDHVAPWRSVYKVGLLTDAEVSFLLTSGGHNAGVVAPPGEAGRSYQMATQAPDAPYIDPERWQHETPVVEGSWWPAWEAWLAHHAGPLVAPPAPVQGGESAPGRYVMEA